MQNIKTVIGGHAIQKRIFLYIVTAKELNYTKLVTLVYHISS